MEGKKIKMEDKLLCVNVNSQTTQKRKESGEKLLGDLKGIKREYLPFLCQEKTCQEEKKGFAL